MADYSTPQKKLKKVSKGFRKSLGKEEPKKKKKKEKKEPSLGERMAESIRARREGRIPEEEKEEPADKNIVQRVIRFLKGRRPD